MTVLFTDEIVTGTELKARQKMWFEKAARAPVSVTSGKKKLVLFNRDTARQMYAYNHYADLLIRLSREQRAGRGASSDVFPWLASLRAEEVAEFYDELLAGFEKVSGSNQWDELQQLLDAWQATAEAKTNPATAELLKSSRGQREYVKLD